MNEKPPLLSHELTSSPRRGKLRLRRKRHRVFCGRRIPDNTARTWRKEQGSKIPAELGWGRGRGGQGLEHAGSPEALRRSSSEGPPGHRTAEGRRDKKRGGTSRGLVLLSQRREALESLARALPLAVPRSFPARLRPGRGKRPRAPVHLAVSSGCFRVSFVKAPLALLSPTSFRVPKFRRTESMKVMALYSTPCFSQSAFTSPAMSL